MNPFQGEKLYVDTHSCVYKEWQSPEGKEKFLLQKIALTPQAIWLDEEKQREDLKVILEESMSTKALPVFVVYRLPDRDMGGYSRGGAKDSEEYLAWVRDVASLLDGFKGVIILEPDALAHMRDIEDPASQEHMRLIKEALNLLKKNRATYVYIDAGRFRWIPASEIARRLERAGIEHADGFSLNVSNFITTSEITKYGEEISKLIGNKHFVIDVSRNGNGPSINPDGGPEWCNPEGRALGVQPTTETGNPLVDALLWIKRPGESDGEENGGPPAGRWWKEYALGLAERGK